MWATSLSVGQRVICSCEDKRLGKAIYHKTGTIIFDARPEGKDALLVQFEEFIGGHDGGRPDIKGKDGFCCWVEPRCLHILS
ncbi:MAG: hypothetical protein V2A77_11310 [Pseudomonadota bacterium]